MASEEVFAVVKISRVQAGEFGAKCSPYFFLSAKDKKYEFDAQEKTRWGNWNHVGVSFDITDEKDIKGEIKVSFWTKVKWNKDKFLGEGSISLSKVLSLGSHSSNSSSVMSTAGSVTKDIHESPVNSRVVETPLEIILVNEKKKKKEDAGEKVEPVYKVKLYIEITGWKVVYNMLGDPSTAAKAISNLIGVAESKTSKKIRTYVRKDILKLMKKLLQSSDTSVELKEQIAIAWGKLLKRDDESLLMMVKEGAIKYLGVLVAKTKEPKVQAILIEHLKAFFKYVSHQQTMIKRGIMEHLIKLISSEHMQVQTKAFEVLLHFDAIHQGQMIKYGILPRLNKLIFVDNIQIQTRALAMIQYFDGIHQEEMIRHGMLPQLMKLISLDKVQLQLKALAVIQHFDVKYHELMIKEGLISQLVELISNTNIQLRLKAFEVTHGFIEMHQQQLIKDGILKKLLEFVQGDNVQIQMKALELISYFDASFSIKEGLLKHLSALIVEKNQELQLKAFDIISMMDASHQEEMVREGILSRLVELLAVSEPPPLVIVDSFISAPQIIGEEPTVADKQEPKDTFYMDILDDLLDYPNPFANNSDVSKWSCGACTFLNSASLTACSICTTPRPVNPVVIPAPTQSLLRGTSNRGSRDTPSQPLPFSDPLVGEQTALDALLRGVIRSEKHFQGDNTSDDESTITSEKDEYASTTGATVATTQTLELPDGPIDENSTAVTYFEDNHQEETRNLNWGERKGNQAGDNSLRQTVNEHLDETANTEDMSTDSVETEGGIDEFGKVEFTVASEPVQMKVELVDAENSTEELTELPVGVIQQQSTQQSSQPWACIACTYVNQDAESDVCEVCGTSKPVVVVQSTIDIPQVVEPVDNNETVTAEVTQDQPLESSTVETTQIVETTVTQEQPEPKIEEKEVPPQILNEVLKILRIFDVRYQRFMIDLKIFKYLRILVENPALQNQVIKTISYFDISFQKEMIEEGILTRLVQLISKKNAKIFLLVIERFQAYQDELMKEGMLKPLIKLLNVDDIQMHTRISDFIMNFDDSYRKEITKQVKQITGISTKLDGDLPPFPSPSPPVNLLPHELCSVCGGIGGHLTTCMYRKPTKVGKSPVVSSSSANYGLMTQAKKLLWQLEHKGIRLLKYKVIYNDGGEYSRKFKVKNLTIPQSSVYSSESVPVANILFEYSGKGIPLLTHLLLKAPRLRFDSPVRTAAVFVSEKPPDIKATQKHDKLTASQFEELKGEKTHRSDPVAFLDLGENMYAETALQQPIKAKYILLKLLTAAKKNFDVEFVGFVGTSLPIEDENKIQSLDLEPKKIEDVGNHLGVRKRVKRIDYEDGDFGSGLLFWIGTNGGEKNWENPVPSGQVGITTSHAMYSIGMKAEDIIGREGGTSCYWGGSCPQFFILDLKHRRLRCNYFSLRHGYQAANSYIQNWEFAGSHDTQNWVTLYEGGETPFSKAFDTKSWPIADGKDYFRYFRILQKGNYSMGKGTNGGGSAYLCIAGFELYGELLRD